HRFGGGVPAPVEQPYIGYLLRLAPAVGRLGATNASSEVPTGAPDEGSRTTMGTISPAAHSPGLVRDTESAVKVWPSPIARSTPGKSRLCACCQVPFTLSATNGSWWSAPSRYDPTAAQLPGVTHDSDSTKANPSALRLFRPGSAAGFPQVPCVCETTKT